MLLDAILDIIRAVGWKRISLIYDIDTMGWSGKKKKKKNHANIKIEDIGVSVGPWTQHSIYLRLAIFLFFLGREYFANRAAKMGIFILAYQPLTTSGVPYDPTFEFVKNKIHSSQSRIQVVIATGSIQDAFLRAMRYDRHYQTALYSVSSLETNIIF